MTEPSYGSPSTPASAGPSGPRASFGLRFVAFLIDFVLLAVLDLILFGALKSAGQALGTIINIAYYTYFEGSPSGQTVGKKVMNIRVVDFNTGGQLDYGRAALRWLCRILSGIPCFLGYFWMLWDKEKQTWHDKLTTSVVVPTSAYPVAAWPG
jgi:uncharacterized RDD family membrane protein YckC